MKLPSPASRPLLPIPLSVLLTLLWVGLVRLFFLWVTTQARLAHDGGVWTAVLFGQPVLGRARLPTVIVAISFLLLLFLWLDYRSRPARAWRSAVFLISAVLLLYLGWAVWYSWWSHLELLTQPVDMLMTAVPTLAPVAG